MILNAQQKKNTYNTRKKLRKAGLKAGLLWGFQMFVFMNYILPYVGSEEISISLFKVVIFICGGGFFWSNYVRNWFIKSKKIILINKNHLHIKLQFYILIFLV